MSTISKKELKHLAKKGYLEFRGRKRLKGFFPGRTYRIVWQRRGGSPRVFKRVIGPVWSDGCVHVINGWGYPRPDQVLSLYLAAKADPTFVRKVGWSPVI